MTPIHQYAYALAFELDKLRSMEDSCEKDIPKHSFYVHTSNTVSSGPRADISIYEMHGSLEIIYDQVCIDDGTFHEIMEQIEKWKEMTK